MESNVTWEYIDALNQVYTEYFFRYQDTPLVIINTDNIDFVENEKDLKEVIDYIRQPVSGTKFFNPVSEFKQMKAIILFSIIGYFIYKVSQFLLSFFTFSKDSSHGEKKEEFHRKVQNMDIQDAEYEDK